MRTKLLYHTNSYMYECTAKVVAVEGDDIALDATIFYPGGGGQMADHGVISWENQIYQATVMAMSKRDDMVWHTLDSPPPRRQRGRLRHRLGLPLPHDAHSHSTAYPLRHDLARVRRSGHWRANVS